MGLEDKIVTFLKNQNQNVLQEILSNFDIFDPSATPLGSGLVCCGFGFYSLPPTIFHQQAMFCLIWAVANLSNIQHWWGEGIDESIYGMKG